MTSEKTDAFTLPGSTWRAITRPGDASKWPARYRGDLGTLNVLVGESGVVSLVRSLLRHFGSLYSSFMSMLSSGSSRLFDPDNCVEEPLCEDCNK